MAETIPANSGRPRRKRPPPRAVTVERIERVTIRLTLVTFHGERLADFGPPKPGAHIKLLFVPDGVQWNPDDPNDQTPRPPSRTYTPRFYDRAARELGVEFVHHGTGLAADWAAAAKPGDPMFIGGPGGGYDVAEDTAKMVLIADDTAIPAAGMVLEALPAGCMAEVLCEIADADDERDLSPLVASAPIWLHRAKGGARQGALLEGAVRTIAETNAASHWWIACEAAAMRRIRDYLMGEIGVAGERLHTRGYWRLGETNYPDHDYGKD
jgi:NADPH-dependent ferric siderophore reductase